MKKLFHQMIKFGLVGVICFVIDYITGLIVLNVLMALFTDPFSKAVFLFCGRKKNTMKALYFDRDGFVLLQKRLDNGKFQWPRNASEVRPLTRQEFRWLMEGLSIDQPKAIQPAKGRDF